MEKITTKKIIEYKKIKTKVPVMKEFSNRFSPRFYKNEKINSKTVASILEAGRLAPSAYNYQPWYFYAVLKDSLAYKKILSSLSESNQKWAKTASLFIVACYIKDCEHGVNKYAQYDLGQAVMSMVIQAQSMGIYSRQMASFDVEKVQKLLPISKDHTPLVTIAMGKIGDYVKIDKELLDKELKKGGRKNNFVKQYGK